MTDEKEPTKRELFEALTRANALIADQGKQIQALMATPVAAAPLAPPKLVPFKGLVRAKDACFIGHLRKAGETWFHEVDCLWSDDPFEPCVQTGMHDDGTPVTEADPNAPQPVPFHLRPRSVDALAARAATPQTAAQW